MVIYTFTVSAVLFLLHRPPRFLTASIDVQRKTELETQIKVNSTTPLSCTV